MRRVLWCVLLWGLAAVAVAAPFDALDADVQRLLAPQAETWDDLPEARQQ